MKKNIFIFAFLLSLFTACESKLDIVPKGQAVLTTVEELESLLNQRYGFSTPVGDLALICNEACAYMSTVSTAYSQPNTLEHAYLFWDESIDRATLSTSDATYNSIYQYVNYMNVILRGKSLFDAKTGICFAFNENHFNFRSIRHFKSQKQRVE